MAAAWMGEGCPPCGGGPSWADRVRGGDGGGGGGAGATYDVSDMRDETTADGLHGATGGGAGAGGEPAGGAEAAAGGGRAEGARAWADVDGDGDEDDDGRAAVATAGDLRRRWDTAARTVRYLERRGGPAVPKEVIEAARRHCEEAERAWRAVREPHPVGRRIRWAAAALDDALAKEAAHRAELRDFEAEVERRRDELLARQGIDEARTARKRKELDDLRAEAGPTGADGNAARAAMDAVRGVRPTLWATRVAAEGIACDVGPALEQALQTVGEDSAAWATLQGALSSVSGVLGVLQAAINDKGAASQYDMAEGDDDDASDFRDSLDDISLPEDGGENGDGTSGASGAGAAGDGNPERGKRRAVEGPGGGATRWARCQKGGEGAYIRLDNSGPRARSSGQGGDGGQLPAGGSSAAAPAGTEAPSGGGLFQGHRPEAVDDAEKQRLAQAMSAEERARAEALHAQQAAATTAAFGSPQALAIAERVHAERLAEVIKGARERDLPIDTAELGAMSAEELEDWARRHV